MHVVLFSEHDGGSVLIDASKRASTVTHVRDRGPGGEVMTSVRGPFQADEVTGRVLYHDALRSRW